MLPTSTIITTFSRSIQCRQFNVKHIMHFHFGLSVYSIKGRLHTFGVQLKINYLILNVKLLLINKSYIDFFLKKFYIQKKFDKFFHIC